LKKFSDSCIDLALNYKEQRKFILDELDGVMDGIAEKL